MPDTNLRETKRERETALDVLIAAEEGDEVMFGSRRNPLEVTDAYDDGNRRIIELEGVRGGEYTLRERYDEDGNLDLSVRGEEANNLYFFERADDTKDLHPEGIAPSRDALSREVVERTAHELGEDVVERKHYQLTSDTTVESLDDMVERRVQKWESNHPDVVMPENLDRLDFRQMVTDAIRGMEDRRLPDGQLLEDYAYELTGYPFGDADHLIDSLPERLKASSGGAFHGRNLAKNLEWTEGVSNDAWTTVEEALSFGFRVPRVIGDWLLFDYGIVNSDDERKLRWLNRNTGGIISLRGRNDRGTPNWYVYHIPEAVDSYDALPELDRYLETSEANLLYEDAGVEGMGNAIDYLRSHMSDEQPADVKVRDHGDELEVWDALSEETKKDKLRRAIDPRDPKLRKTSLAVGTTVFIAAAALATTTPDQRTAAKNRVLDVISNPKKEWQSKNLLSGGLELTSNGFSALSSSVVGMVKSMFTSNDVEGGEDGKTPAQQAAGAAAAAAEAAGGGNEDAPEEASGLSRGTLAVGGTVSTLIASTLWSSFGISFTPKIRTNNGEVTELDLDIEYEYRGLSNRFLRIETRGEGVAGSTGGSIPVPERDLFVEDALRVADNLGLSEATIRLGYSARKRFDEGGDSPMGRGLDWLRENWRDYDQPAPGYTQEVLGHKSKWDDPQVGESYGKLSIIRQRRVGVSNPSDENVAVKKRFAVVQQRRDGRWVSYEHTSGDADDNSIYFYPEETYDHYDTKTATPLGIVQHILERATHDYFLNYGTEAPTGEVIEHLNSEYGQRGVELFGAGAGQVDSNTIKNIIQDVREGLAGDVGEIGSANADAPDDTERDMQRQAGITEEDEQRLEEVREMKGRSRDTFHTDIDIGEPLVTQTEEGEVPEEVADEGFVYNPDFDEDSGDRGYGEYGEHEDRRDNEPEGTAGFDAEQEGGQEGFDASDVDVEEEY